MYLRPAKLLLILLVPLLAYGLGKGVMYYNAKRTVDDLVLAASNQAEIRYQGISTDLRGAVVVTGIEVQRLGYDDIVEIDRVRVSSDDLMFFVGGGQWQPGKNRPPNSLGFTVSGVRVPLDSEMLAASSRRSQALAPDKGPCDSGLRVEPDLLKTMGFTELAMAFDGHYRLDETARTLDFGVNMTIDNIESMEVSATLSDIDMETLAQGAAPQLNLAGFDLAVTVSPEFGRQAIKACALGSEQTLEELSAAFAEKALADLEVQGLTLGSGLRRVVQDFYREWGEFRIAAVPAQPVGLLSLVFLPPNELADALSLRLTLNDKLITDTRFDWQRPDVANLSSWFGEEPPEAAYPADTPTKRIMVRRQYERVAPANVPRYIDHKVKVKPRGQPMREGVLKRVVNGEAEVEQILHGGKFTVYVPMDDIETAEVLVRREVPVKP